MPTELTVDSLREACERHHPGSCARFSDDDLAMAIERVLGPTAESGELEQFAVFAASMMFNHNSAAMNVAVRFVRSRDPHPWLTEALREALDGND